MPVTRRWNRPGGRRGRVGNPCSRTHLWACTRRYRPTAKATCVAASVAGCFVSASRQAAYGATVAALTFLRLAAERTAALDPVGPTAYGDAVCAQPEGIMPKGI